MAGRGNREYEDAWGGFDAQETVYNEKEEKRYESAVWKYIMAVALVVLILVIYHDVKEFSVIHNGISIEAEYHVYENGSEVARYRDEENRLHIFDVTGKNAVHNEAKITLYYLDNIDDAIPKSAWTERVWYYTFFGTLLGICLWRLRKIYKKIRNDS